MLGEKVTSVGVIIWKWKKWPSVWSLEVHARSFFVGWRYFSSTREVPGHKCRCRDKVKEEKTDQQWQWVSVKEYVKVSRWMVSRGLFCPLPKHSFLALLKNTLLSSVSLQHTFPFFQGKGQLNLETKGRSKIIFTVVTTKTRGTWILDAEQQFVWNWVFLCLL